MGTVIVINSDRMGYGDGELGRKLMGTRLRKLSNADGLDAVVLYSSGARGAMPKPQAPACISTE